jgi:hypothetical protein
MKKMKISTNRQSLQTLMKDSGNKSPAYKILCNLIVLLASFALLFPLSGYSQVVLSNSQFTTLAQGQNYTSISIPNYDPGTDENRL